MSDVDRTPLSADGPSQHVSGDPTGTELVRPTVRLTASTSSSRRGRPWRWVVALFTTAFMLVGTLGIAAFAQTTRFGAGEGPSFLPADAVAYAEARLDLPGDQRDQLIEFLGHLPGFADPAAFDTKLDETLDQLLGGPSSPLSWTEDIKPWFSGQLMFGVADVPAMDATVDPGAAAAAAITALGVTDRAALDAALAKLLAGSGDSVTSEAYAGTTISTVGDMAVAPTDTLLLFSNDADQVKAALDVLGGSEPSLADDPGFQSAIAAMPADRLGAFVVDADQLATVLGPLLEQQLASQPNMGSIVPQLDAALGMLPGTITGHITVEGDHLTARIDALAGDGMPALSVRETDLASRMPADTVLYLEARDLGAVLNGLLAQLKPLLSAQGNDQALAQIEALLGTGLDTYLDWVQDIAISASLTAQGPSVGLVATVTDVTTGKKRVDALLTLVRLVSAFPARPTESSATPAPPPVEITTKDGVTTISLTEASGMTSNLPVEPTISLGFDDDHFYLGLGDFAAQAMAREPAESLAATPGYMKALDAVGAENAGVVYVDVASALSFAELLMGSDQRIQFEEQLKPYAGALDFIVASLGRDETSSSASLRLFVK
jgi:hypothetical protein